MLRVWRGTVAILGGTEIFGRFLPRYDIFHLSHVAGLRLPFGRAVFPEVPQHSSQAVLSLSGLTQAAERMLDVSRSVTLSTWLRRGRSSCLIQATVILLNGDVRLLQG